MNNFVQDGNSTEYTNSGSAIASGAVVVLVDHCGIAMTDIAATTGKGTVSLTGVYTLAKDADEAFLQGDPLHYDSSDSTVTKTPSATTTPIGTAHAAAATDATSAQVRLESQPKRSAAQIDFVGADVAAVKVEMNAFLAKLRAAGILKS